jgi:hypothetical protein
LDVDAEDARFDARVETLLHISLEAGLISGRTKNRCRTIVQFQDRATQARDFINFCQSSLKMVYNAMFPQNKQPESFDELKVLFKRTENIHHFVRAQLVGGAKLALAWVRYHHRKIDFHLIARGFSDKKKYYLTRHYDAISEPAERMIDRLLERDANFFSEFHYDAMAQVPNELLDKTKLEQV